METINYKSIKVLNIVADIKYLPFVEHKKNIY